MRARARARVALFAILLAIVAVRVVWSSRGEWRAARRPRRGDDEIVHLGRAARLYAPGNPYSRRAVDKLADDRPRRSGARARRVARAALGAPGDALVLHAAPRAPRRGQRAHRRPHGRRRGRRRHAARARAKRAPGTPRAWRRTKRRRCAWTLVALVGLAAWIGCALGLLLRGIGDDDRLRPRAALAWALGVGAGLALFFLGLARA